jgi:hypothetical protein
MLILLLFLFTSCVPVVAYVPLMSGDCVDRAVIIRQQLMDQGYEAELVLGLRGDKEGHCWVKYKDKETGEWKTIKNY